MPLNTLRKFAPIALVAASTLGLGATGAAPAGRRVDAPQWVKNAVFYQIFPERFANGNKRNDPPGVQPWGGVPTPNNFFGGDLAGIRQHIGYLRRLGVTAIYLNPIFQAPSNHKYDTTNYLKIDPHFGTLADFRALVHDLHAAHIRVILDGVFNHTGTTFHAFKEAVAKGPTSPYWTWYTFYGFPVVEQPKPNYASWWGLWSLPKLNYANPAVRSYILDKVVPFWGRQGIDGWRLDVPNEITQPGFWQDFRKAVKAINPDAYLVGEIWTDPRAWIRGNKFDATMNYPFRDAVLGFAAGKTSPSAFDATLAAQRADEGTATDGMFNLLGSHDTERLLTAMGGDAARQRLAALVQFTYPGAPVIYYGDEIGMSGPKDPGDRGCFDWNRKHWNLATHAFYRRLIALRKAHPALRTGSFQTLLTDDRQDVFAYERQLGRDRLVVVLNAASASADVTLPAGGFPDGTRLTDLLTGDRHVVQAGHVELPHLSLGGALLVRSR